MKSKFLQVRKMLLVAAGLLVGVSAWADTVNATLEHTASTFCGTNTSEVSYSLDGEKEHINLEGSSTYQGYAFAEFSWTLDEGESILSATLTWTATSAKGYSNTIYYLNAGEALDYNAISGKTAGLLRKNGVKTSIGVNDGFAGDKTSETDVTSAIFDMIKAGQSSIIFQWTANQGGADLYGKGSEKAPTLVITTTTAQAYTVTFKEKNNVTFSIIGDGFVVNNGTATLVDGSYKYTATASGYQNYNGTFDVDGSDQTVEFEMTAKKPVESVKVVYKIADGTEITSEEQADITGLYVGETATIPFRMYVTKDGKLYETKANGTDPYYGENGVVLVENVVVDKTVTEVNLGSGTLVFFKDFDASDGNNANVRASYNSAYDNKAYTSEETIPAGIYKFIVRHYNRGRGSSIVVGETTVFTAEGSLWGTYTKENVMIPEAGQLSFVAGGSKTIDLYDVIIAIKTGDAAISTTISDAGWATLYTPYALDFSETGLTAYTATCDGETVTLTQVKDVPANTGVVLKGEADTYEIPVIASSETTPGDLKGSATEALEYDDEAENDYYMLALNAANEAQFTKLIEGSIAAGKAYLELPKAAEARALSVVFAGETTGIAEVEKAGAENGAIYNLSGQRVSKPANGLYIVNGKKVVIK